jgi:hypothetical protein
VVSHGGMRTHSTKSVRLEQCSRNLPLTTKFSSGWYLSGWSFANSDDTIMRRLFGSTNTILPDTSAWVFHNEATLNPSPSARGIVRV